MQDQLGLIEKYVNEPVWAVVGASNNPAKYGNRIYLKLKESGYRVYPVNNRERLIEGDTAYSSLLELPETPAVVNMGCAARAGACRRRAGENCRRASHLVPARCRECRCRRLGK